MTRGLLVGILLLSLGVSRHSFAQTLTPDSHSVPPRRQPSEELAPGSGWRWYGWQTLAVDGGSVAALLAAAYLGDGQLLVPVSVVGYGLGGPAVHAFHHKPLKALGSIALRVGLPATGLALGLGAAECPPKSGDYGNCGTVEAVLGLGAGLLLASVVDAAALGWEREPEPTSSPELSVVPVLSPDGKRGELRVIGRF